MYRLDVSKKAKKDYEIAKRAGFGGKIAEILSVVVRNPFEPTPGHYFERLKGNLKDMYSRRINYHNRFFYTVHPNTENVINEETGELYEGIVYVHELWGHDKS